MAHRIPANSLLGLIELAVLLLQFTVELYPITFIGPVSYVGDYIALARMTVTPTNRSNATSAALRCNVRRLKLVTEPEMWSQLHSARTRKWEVPHGFILYLSLLHFINYSDNHKTIFYDDNS